MSESMRNGIKPNEMNRNRMQSRAHTYTYTHVWQKHSVHTPPPNGNVLLLIPLGGLCANRATKRPAKIHDRSKASTQPARRCAITFNAIKKSRKKDAA